MNKGFLSIFLLILLDIALIGGAISIYKEANEYNAYYKLAEQSSTPELATFYLEQYLDKIENLHGYNAIIFKNPSTNIDEHKEIIRSIIARCKQFSYSEENILKSNTFEYRLWSDIKTDMNRNEFKYTKYLVLNYHKELLILAAINIILPVIIAYYINKSKNFGYNSDDIATIIGFTFPLMNIVICYFLVL